MLGGATLLHLLFAWGETTLTHSTAHVRLAVHEMTNGRYRAFFWTGIALSTLAILACGLSIVSVFPSRDVWVGLAAGPLALAGLLAYEHAYVQAGQAVPLA